VLIAGFIDDRRSATQDLVYAQQSFFGGVGWIGD
jgi:hypothetical protein